MSIMATLWGKLARTKGLKVGCILAVKGAKITDYGEMSLNIGESHSRVEIDPNNIEEFRRLKAWHLANKKATFTCVTKLAELGLD